jgi:hypothetical protein
MPEKTLQKSISKVSTDKDATSVFDFDLKPEEVTADLKFSVTLTSPTAAAKLGATPSPARYPQDGSLDSLNASVASKVVKIVLVPVQYAADGSNRLPDTSTAQLELYRKTMIGVYPTAAVDIQVHKPFPYQGSISGSQGWENVLDAITKLRSQDKAAADVYYYGVFSPTASFNQFCNGGCIAGLSWLADNARDSMNRASVGVGFQGDVASTTMAHEIGHAHGRDHAPCGGVAGADPSYPKDAAHSNATLGVWGFNINSGQFIDPGASKTPHDLMSYCDPAWISDYQYAALFKRVSEVNALPISPSIRGVTAPQQPEETYRMARVDGAGMLSWNGEIVGPADPGGESRPIRWAAAAAGAQGIAGLDVSADARFFRYDHLPGGMLLVRKTAQPMSTIEFQGRRFAVE